MKYLKKFNENNNSDEDYITITERTFYELDDKFRLSGGRFFPLKVTLEEYNGNYNLSILLALGWITRMSDDDIDWLHEYISELNQNKNLSAAFMGDSSGRIVARKLFSMQNKDFPNSSMDYLSFPEGPYPDRD